jgi:hypothetical protein
MTTAQERANGLRQCRLLLKADTLLLRAQRRWLFGAAFFFSVNAVMGWSGLQQWWQTRAALDGTVASLNLMSGAWLLWVALRHSIPLHLRTLEARRRVQAIAHALERLCDIPDKTP